MNEDDIDTIVKVIEPKKEEQRRQKKTVKQAIEHIAKDIVVGHLITPHDKVSLSDRCNLRINKEQINQQENLERIFKLAYDSCNAEKAVEIDPDWLAHFMLIAKHIRNPSMQRLWSRILKQECTYPGSISLKTLDTLKSMTNKEAQVFHKASTLTCYFGIDKSKKLLTAIKIKHNYLPTLLPPTLKKINLGNFHLPYSDLLILIELGLILRSELESGEFACSTLLSFHYQNHSYRLSAQQKGISFTYYRLSPTGQEIAELLGSKAHEPFRESILELINSHFIVEHQ
ncbi:TIGR03899 family protein [Photobacterium nomapromontoriensis]|uniref:TIGR03899 family protein n=1 Tax=Photobacterium nomapromontoriensis TaxID=2910237 RepID=UPI003D0E74B2